jgi:ABC-2 type transport system permease protein
MLLAQTAAAWWFGRGQFARSLRFDADAARSAARVKDRRSILDVLARVIPSLTRDPVAALLEKEIRVLSRAPRFRLLFFMGFSFGLLIWLPLAFRSDGALRDNYLTVVSAYAIMLLGDVCFWNSFGMDRSAAQAYFVMPVSVKQVLLAKNIAGAFFVLLEIVAVTLACVTVRFPVTSRHLGEALAVSCVVVPMLLAAGNLLSTRNARPIDPSNSWGGRSGGRSQAMLLLVYPAISAPVFLAYGARYAFEDSDLAFYGVLALDLVIGAIVYAVALESAAEAAVRGRERLLAGLSASQGPLGG